MIAATLAVALVAAWLIAGSTSFHISHDTPTISVEASKQWGVFRTRLDATPRSIDIGGHSYRIDSAWLEYRAEPWCIAYLLTLKHVHPDLILCVQIRSNDGLAMTAVQQDIRIENARSEHIHVAARNDVFYSEVGTRAPDRVILRSERTSDQASIMLKAMPNQSPQPTSAAVTSPAEQGPRRRGRG